MRKLLPCGTVAAYRRGCRCESCVLANSRDCRSRYAAQSEARRRKRRAHYEANRESVLAAQKRYYDMNQSAVAERNRAYRARNRDEIEAMNIDYRVRNQKFARTQARRAHQLRQQASGAAALAHRLEWSAVDDAIVMNDRWTCSQKASLLGRTYGAVVSRRARLFKSGWSESAAS